MKRTDFKVNEVLSKVVDRFQFHSEKAKSENPIIAELAEKMCEIEIWEMWELTQG